MNALEEEKEKPSFAQWVLWLSLPIVIYLLSTGPVTRYWPALADIIYAPLEPLAENKVLGAALRGWLSVWGVQF